MSSSPAALSGLPTRRFARRNARSSIGPDGGTPTSQAPSRPGQSCTLVSAPGSITSMPRAAELERVEEARRVGRRCGRRPRPTTSRRYARLRLDAVRASSRRARRRAARARRRGRPRARAASRAADRSSGETSVPASIQVSQRTSVGNANALIVPALGRKPARGALGVEPHLDRGAARRGRLGAGATSGSPAATRSIHSTRSMPVTSSVTPCSTWRRVLTSRK